MIKKTFIKAQDLLDDSFRLGLQIIRDGFHPDYIVGIWRGGSPIAIAVQELLSFHGFPSDHIAVRTSSYCGIEKQRDQVQVQGLQYIIDNVTAVNSLLIVDTKSKDNILRSTKNIPNVKLTDANHFSAFDLVKYKKIIFTESSVKELEKRYQ